MYVADTACPPGLSPPPPLNIMIIGTNVQALVLALSLVKTTNHTIRINVGTPSDLVNDESGLFLASNAVRVLKSLDLFTAVVSTRAVAPTHISQRGWADNTEVNKMYVTSHKYCEACLLVRIADLKRVLVDAVRKSPRVNLDLGTRIVDVEENGNKVSVKTMNDEWIDDFDVVLVADGIRSKIRDSVFAPDAAGVKPTGEAAFSFVLPREMLLDNPHTRLLVVDDRIRTPVTVMARWLGPRSHILGFLTSGGDEYNIMVVHTDGQSWTSTSELRAAYSDWNATVQALLGMVPADKVLRAEMLKSHAPLPRWVQGRIALLGDAAHPILPYSGQPMAQGIEDAVTLAYALGQAKSKDVLPLMLRVWEEWRRKRVDAIQQESARARESYHLEDGIAQRERDEEIRALVEESAKPLFDFVAVEEFAKDWDDVINYVRQQDQ